jgi:pimeloyl-ACP methyl ester carboxylesterase
MRPDAELFADQLQSFLIDPHGSGESTPPSKPEGYTPAGHAQFYEEVRQALGLDRVVVFGHSFGASTALTYCALYSAAAARCVSAAGGGLSSELDEAASQAARVEMETALSRHADAPWYREARATIDEWTERVLATDDPGEVEEMMVTVLPFYTAHPDHPEVAAALADMRAYLTVDLAAVKEREGGVFQTFDPVRCWRRSRARLSSRRARRTSSAVRPRLG